MCILLLSHLYLLSTIIYPSRKIWRKEDWKWVLSSIPLMCGATLWEKKQERIYPICKWQSSKLLLPLTFRAGSLSFENEMFSICVFYQSKFNHCNLTWAVCRFLAWLIRDCPLADSQKEDGDTVCLTITIVEHTKNSFLQLDFIRDLLIHFLLGTVIRGLYC